MTSKNITITEKTEFDAKEVGILFFAMRFTSAEVDKQLGGYPTRKPEDTDSFEVMLLFKELKKWLDEKGIPKKCSLVLWTTQKAMLLNYVKSIQREVGDLEQKFSVIEKLS